MVSRTTGSSSTIRMRARAGGALTGVPGTTLLMSRLDGQADREGRPLVHLALHGDGPAQLLGQPLADGQEQPGAWHRTTVPRRHAEERLEDPLLLLRREAGAIVGDDQDDLVALEGRGHADLAELRVPSGGHDQVPQHLLETPGVGDHSSGLDLGIADDDDAVAPWSASRLDRPDHLLN